MQDGRKGILHVTEKLSARVRVMISDQVSVIGLQLRHGRGKPLSPWWLTYLAVLLAEEFVGVTKEQTSLKKWATQPQVAQWRRSGQCKPVKLLIKKIFR
jgi:hypothetical protein